MRLKPLASFIAIICYCLCGCNLMSPNAAVLKNAKNRDYQTDNVVKVNNVEEFIRALDNNTTIVIAPGEYVFSDNYVLDENYTEVLFLDTLSEHYKDGYIHDIDHLSIVGLGKHAVNFLQDDGYQHVLEFKDVSDVYIENMRMGHSPEVGHCRGGVVLVQNAKNVYLNNLELFGSGTEGLSIISVEDFTIVDSWITKCSEQLSTFSHVRNGVVSNCKFTENIPSLRGFTFYNSSVKFDNTVIEEKYPFFLENFDYSSDPEETYDMLFSIDRFDFGKWYAGYDDGDIKLLVPPIESSKVEFHNTIVNGEVINGKMDIDFP